MPQMSSVDATYIDAQDIIYPLHHLAPETPLVKLGNVQKEALRNQADIFIKLNSPTMPPRVPVREINQKKLQELNQEVTIIKITPQSKPFTNV